MEDDIRHVRRVLFLGSIICGRKAKLIWEISDLHGATDIASLCHPVAKRRDPLSFAFRTDPVCALRATPPFRDEAAKEWGTKAESLTNVMRDP
ncbi:hypothetical protein [Terriglobus saanensis]|uniref:hypothetical protein n=1 Tax=Terriglobus saanensis TaxID=870903 RepID=UPI0005A25042|nr:hypothetical protein [Terriglobus saanensis]